jgi:hypothetical protein
LLALEHAESLDQVRPILMDLIQNQASPLLARRSASIFILADAKTAEQVAMSFDLLVAVRGAGWETGNHLLSIFLSGSLFSSHFNRKTAGLYLAEAAARIRKGAIIPGSAQAQFIAELLQEARKYQREIVGELSESVAVLDDFVAKGRVRGLATPSAPGNRACSAYSDIGRRLP